MDRLKDLKSRSSAAPSGGTFASPVPAPGATLPETSTTAVPMPGTSFSEPPRGDNDAIEMSSAPTQAIESDAILENFYRLVAEVQTHIREIQNKTQELQLKFATQMRTVDTDKNKAMSDEIGVMMNSTNEHATMCKTKLQMMNEGTAKLKKTPEDEAANAAVIKIQQNQQAHLLRMYSQALQDYQAVQQENKTQRIELTARQIQTKCMNPDNSTISDEEARQMAQEAIQYGTQDAIFQQSKEALASIIETRNEIYVIEQSLRHINQLFNDLAVLVNEQGEIMDQVATNVQSATRFVDKGRSELAQGKKYAKKSKKKMCWLILLAFFIFLLILAPTLGFTLKAKPDDEN